jgi:hypothetical protein
MTLSLGEIARLLHQGERVDEVLEREPALNELPSAEFFARQACRHPNAPAWPFATLTSVLGHLGKLTEATTTLKQLLIRRLGYRQMSARDDLFFCADEEFIVRYLKGLEHAGVPA